MRNFNLLSRDADVIPLLNAVLRQPELWNAVDLRTTFEGSPFRDVDDILLRFNPVGRGAKPEEVADAAEAENYPAMHALPQCRPLIFGLMARVEGERLGRAMITRLKPGGRILRHADQGPPATYYDRYHIVLQAAPGSIFECGDEHVQMMQGEVWWVNNALEHAVINNGAIDRIHLIADVRTFR